MVSPAVVNVIFSVLFKSYAHLTQFLVGITHFASLLLHQFSLSVTLLSVSLFLIIIISSLFVRFKFWSRSPLSPVRCFTICCYWLDQQCLFFCASLCNRLTSVSPSPKVIFKIQSADMLECWSQTRQFFKSLAVISSTRNKVNYQTCSCVYVYWSYCLPLLFALQKIIYFD